MLQRLKRLQRVPTGPCGAGLGLFVTKDALPPLRRPVGRMATGSAASWGTEDLRH